MHGRGGELLIDFSGSAAVLNCMEGGLMRAWCLMISGDRSSIASRVLSPGEEWVYFRREIWRGQASGPVVRGGEA